MNKIVLNTVLLLGLLLSCVLPFSYADEDDEVTDANDWSVSGYGTLASDYVWRGVSQTQSKPAFQHGLTASHSDGFYVGYFLSNVDFEPNFAGRDNPATEEDEGDVFQPGIELDIIGGIYYEIDQDFAVDIGGVIYTYNFSNRESNSRNYGEIYINFEFLSGQLILSTNYTADYLGLRGKANYYALLFDVDVATHVAIRGGIGSTMFSQRAANNNSVGGPSTIDANGNSNLRSVLDYKIGVAIKWNDGKDEVEFAFIGLDQNGRDFFGGDGGEAYGPTYEDRLVVSFSKSF